MQRAPSTGTGGPSPSGTVRALAWQAVADVRSLPPSNTNQSPLGGLAAGADQKGVKDAGRNMDGEKQTALWSGLQELRRKLHLGGRTPQSVAGTHSSV
jgi:hypothetical protein